MTAAIGYALAAMVLYGLGDFVFKRGATGPFETHQFIMMQSAAFLSMVILYGLATESLVAMPAVAWGLVAGVFMFVGFNCFALSLQHGNVSINAPIFRLNFIVTAVLAVGLLGEPVTVPKLAGLGLALVAIRLLVGSARGGLPRGAHENNASGAKRVEITAAGRLSLVLVVIATLALGTGNVVHKIGLSHGAPLASLLAAHSAVYLTLATVIAVRADAGIVIPRAAWPYALSGAATTMGGFVMLLSALAVANASVVVPIAQMGLVVSALLGVAVLGEPFTPRKAAGMVLAVTALGLLAMS